MQTATAFYGIRRIPRVVGLIDGTHIRIQAPSDEHLFVNRKQTHSINVQVSRHKLHFCMHNNNID